MTATESARALDLLKTKGMLRLKDFIAEDIEPETLARVVRDEQMIRPARGLYQLPDTQIDAAYMLAEAAVLVPKGIVCPISVLWFHSLTLQMPSAVWVAIGRAASAHRYGPDFSRADESFQSRSLPKLASAADRLPL
jgi:hypothetical protein